MNEPRAAWYIIGQGHMTSHVRFSCSLPLDDILALYADAAGQALSLGRPAAFVRTRYEGHYDHYSRTISTDGWPATTEYAGDGATLFVDVQSIDLGNPYDGSAYWMKAVLTLPSPRAARVTLDTSASSYTACSFRLHIDGDSDDSVFDIVRALARARVPPGVTDESVKPRGP